MMTEVRSDATLWRAAAEGCPARPFFAMPHNKLFQFSVDGRSFDSAAPQVFPNGVSMSIDRALVDAALASIADPNTGRPFAAAKNLKNVVIDGATVSVEVVLGYPAKR